ncbi:hypothetical protein DPMN_171471 [Dreissena polymorpha]|uniref:Uncharacterized protein n=1 Tax=Dreissena polymorpha TaxID=45954 RepID=A0A9D4DZS2_DREPO|nr:hypothetical protein DPMN_171471 [Dreissena polymorpha]
MRSAVDPATAKEQRARRRRRNAVETAPVPEPAPVPVPGPKPETQPAKRRRADDSAANCEVIDFLDISSTVDGLPRGHNVGEHETLACYASDNLLSQVCHEWITFKAYLYCLYKLHLPASLKQRIFCGEYVNIALLLKGAVGLADYTNGGSIFVLINGSLESRPKECRDVINTIERWSDAFIMFTDMY